MTLSRRGHAIRLTMVIVAGSAACFGEEQAPPAGPPIDRLVWRCPRKIDWRLESTPLWYSMGHANRILAIIPVGLIERDGKVLTTRDGTGSVRAVNFEVHHVTKFDAATGLPVNTKLVERRTVHADDEPKKRQRRWPFGSEQGYDWEMKKLPPLQVQTLLRMFLHDRPQLWHTLMIHCESTVEPLPPAHQQKGKATKFFSDFRTHILVMQLLNDPGLPLVSTYIEADDPPSTRWIAKEEVPAPWAVGKSRLEPVTGSIVAGNGDGPPAFKVLSDAAAEAAKAIQPSDTTDEAPRPEIADDPDLEAVPGELEFEEPSEK